MLRLLVRWLWRLAGAVALLFLLYQLWILGHVWYWVGHNPSTSAFMEERLDTLKEENPQAELKHKWVPYPQISNHLKRALIAAEDGRFLEHEGFDWEGIQKAYEKNMKKGKIVAGGSTISQQLSKNLFLSSKRTPWRKAQEVVITLILERIMDKRRILEIYANVIEWGNGIFGAEAAAHHYFHVSAAKLSAEQAARLAAMVPKPRYYATHPNSASLQRRTAAILVRMNDAQIP